MRRIDLSKRWPNGAVAMYVTHIGLKASGTLYHNTDGTWCFRFPGGAKRSVTDLSEVEFHEKVGTDPRNPYREEN